MRGFYNTMESNRTIEDAYAPLTQGVCLHHRYMVRAAVTWDSFCFVYHGFDSKVHQEVEIWEFFPRNIAERADGSPAVSPINRSCGALFFLASDAFQRQYAALHQAIGCANIISVFDAFFENGTAYAVTERVDGVSLATYVAMQDRPLIDGELGYIAGALSDALLVVHSLSILHHDITKDNILLCTDGTVKLTDFGAARNTVQTHHEVDDSKPWIDIRALGRALYTAYTGNPVPEPVAAICQTVPAMIAGVFERMLTDDPALRFESVFDFMHAADGINLAAVRPQVTQARIAEYEARLRNNRAHSVLEQRRSVEQAARGVRTDRRRGQWRITVVFGGTILLVIALTVLIIRL